jgi:hypothetical protein
VAQVGINSRQAFEDRVIDGGDQWVVAIGAYGAFERGIDHAQAQQVVDVRVFDEIAAEQFGDER